MGIVACLLMAAVVLGADVSEYPSLNHAGIRALATGSLPLLGLGALNLLALDGAGGAQWSRLATWIAVAGNVFLLATEVKVVRAGGPPLGWLLAGVAVLLVVGSVVVGVARARREAVTGRGTL